MNTITKTNKNTTQNTQKDGRAITVEATTSEDEDTLLLSSQETVVDKRVAGGNQTIKKDMGVCDNQKETIQSDTCGNRPDSIPKLGCFRDRKLYQRARFILDKVEKNEAAGKFDPRDAADKLKFQKILEDLSSSKNFWNSKTNNHKADKIQRRDAICVCQKIEVC